MRVIAVLTTFNEEVFIRPLIEHLLSQGVELYLMDNCSTDGTVDVARGYLGHGVTGIETIARNGVFSLRAQLKRKEELFASLEADWFMHIDADEIHHTPRCNTTLAESFLRSEQNGFNAVNFLEFTFVPTSESPDHDHPDYQESMHWYYPFLPSFPHRLNAWKRHPAVELEWSAGHLVRFPGLVMDPVSLHMRHYLFLSVDHAIRKFIAKGYDPEEVAMGWMGWRARMSPELLKKLPSETDLRASFECGDLDSSEPRKVHHLQDVWEAGTASSPMNDDEAVQDS
jgi:glycosyltransferase involved in cell wall biosynthesis